MMIMTSDDDEPMIRPVCTRLPSSAELWEDTNLPLSTVITPLEFGSASTRPPPLTSIPKCLHCGAPHGAVVSHYPLHRSLLCHLCGKISSTRHVDQAVERLEENMDASVYNEKHQQSPKATPSPVLEYSLPVLGRELEVPANTCPPLWWIVMEGSPSRRYWNSITSALEKMMKKLPPHVHIGLAMASSQSISLWKVQSAVPYVQHYPWTAEDKDIEFGNLRMHGMHISSALRAMADLIVCDTEGRLPLCEICRLFLTKLTTEGRPVGFSTGDNNTRMPYAGARMLLLLNGPPLEMGEGNELDAEKHIGGGGRGGSCSEPGQRFSASATTTASGDNDDDVPALAEDDPELGGGKQQTSKTASDDDLTPAGLAQHYFNAEQGLEQKFAQLGQDFAQAAIGVDVVVVTDEPNQNFGLPLITPLCDRSGAPGPVIINLNDDEAVVSLEKELASRRPTSFGGLLRVRLSPGFQVDTSAMEGNKREKGPQLGPLYVKKGLYGPACGTKDAALWQIGVCDPSQTFTLDLQVTNKIQRNAFVNGLGEVALKPCCQVSYAYTSIVQKENGEYVTVRRLRVSTLHTPVANDTESLYASLDVEALSVVLFHKLAAPALIDGLVDIQEIGRNWLKYALVCAMNSAQALDKHLKSHPTLTTEAHGMFYPAERLLDRQDGELKQEEVLLGQGHEYLASLPLLVWSLLQSDCFRPASNTFRPTLDARFAVLQQMAGMSPSGMSRCIAPRMELWQSGEDVEEAIVTDMELSMESVTMHLMEYQQTDPDLILFVDSSNMILVCDSRHLRWGGKDEEEEVIVGDALQEAIDEAQASYRTAPEVMYALDLSIDTTHLWKDILIEDAGTAADTFCSWKKKVANDVQKDVQEGA